MATSFKSNNSQRGKPYALMLLLAFGAAVLGVMVLHKLREKRIFSLLVKEKDHELLTLHLLLQREKEFNNKAQKKVEEMKNKVYSLRSQKLELDRRLLEMESTISSMRDERKVIESALEEKKSEIKMLTEEGMNSSSIVFSEVAALHDTIKLKEAEIEELKLQLNKTNNIQSLDINAEANFTGSSTRQHNGNDGMLQLNSNANNNVTKSEGGSQTDRIIKQENEQATNKTDIVDDMEEDEPRMRREAALYKWMDEQTGNSDNGRILINKDENQEKKTAEYHSDEGPRGTEKGNETTSNHGNSQDQDDQSLTSLNENGLLEKSDGNGKGLATRVRRKYSRGKRLRYIAGNRRSGDSIHSLTKGTGEDDAEIETKKEGISTEDRLPLLDIHNQTLETGSDSVAREREGVNEEAHKWRATETRATGAEITENVDKQGNSLRTDATINENAKPKLISAANSDKNDTKQTSDENSGQIHETEANRKLLKMQNTNVKYENDDDEEDAEIHEPEIDKADIKRFSESDPDEEEAEEAAEEAEF